MHCIGGCQREGEAEEPKIAVNQPNLLAREALVLELLVKRCETRADVDHLHAFLPEDLLASDGGGRRRPSQLARAARPYPLDQRVY